MNLSVPTAEMLALLLGAARTGAWMMVCPPFNSRLIPGPVKALLSIGLTLPVFPQLRGALPSLQTSDIIFSVALQVFVGAGLVGHALPGAVGGRCCRQQHQPHDHEHPAQAPAGGRPGARRSRISTRALRRVSTSPS